MKTFENVASLKLAKLKAGQFVETGGYYEKGGTGAARYFIKTSAQATLDGDVYSASSMGNILIGNGNVAVLLERFKKLAVSWGVSVALSNNSQGLQESLNYVMSKSTGQELCFPDGDVNCEDPIYLTDVGRSAFLTLSGSGLKSSRIIFSTQVDACIYSRNIEFVTLKGLTFDGGGSPVLFDIEKRLGVADLDFEFESTSLINASKLVKARGRGVVFRGGNIGLCDGDVLEILSVEGLPDQNTIQHAMRHYTFEGVRFDSVSNVIKTPETGDTHLYVTNAQIVGCDLYSVDHLIDIGGRLLGLTVVGNTAINSFVDGIVSGKSLSRVEFTGNVFQNEWDNSQINNATDGIPTVFDLESGSEINDIDLSDNVIRGVYEQVFKTGSTTKAVSIEDNTFPGLWEYDDASSGKVLFFGIGGDEGLSIKGNKLRSDNVSGVTHRIIDEVLYPPESVEIEANEPIGIPLLPYRGRYTPELQLDGVNHSSYVSQTAYYTRNGDYIKGTVFIDADNISVGTEIVTISLPVVGVSDNPSSGWSGDGVICDILGVETPVNELVSMACKVQDNIRLNVVTDSGTRQLLNSDIGSVFSLQCTFEYRFR